MKTKLVIGIVLAVTALVIGQYFFLPGWYRELGVKPSGWLMMLSVALGIALSVWLISYIAQKLLEGKPFDLFGLSTTARKGSKVGSYVVGVLSYPFALFLGFVVGGNLGGGFGGYAGDVGVIIGLGLGVFVITALVATIAVIVGFVLGGLTEKLKNRLHA